LREYWCDHSHLGWAASPVRRDMIFGRDNGARKAVRRSPRRFNRSLPIRTARTWVNVYSPWNIISSKLDYYDLPDRSNLRPIVNAAGSRRRHAARRARGVFGQSLYLRRDRQAHPLIEPGLRSRAATRASRRRWLLPSPPRPGGAIGAGADRDLQECVSGRRRRAR